MSDLHYLRCINENCEKAACTDRRVRDQENFQIRARVKELEAKLEYWQKDSAAACDKCEERRQESARLVAENDKLAERNGEHAITNARLRKLIKDIDHTLRVPAAEYVPAISDVFTLIDRELNGEKYKCRHLISDHVGVTSVCRSCGEMC